MSARVSGKRVLVIGAGVGGLTAGALLANAGHRVTVVEAQTYPGGCAGTFPYQGYRFEAGATVAGGFQPGGPHEVVGRQLGITWPVTPHDPAWVVHLDGEAIPLDRSFEDVYSAFPDTERFWRAQRAVASRIWPLAATGLPWPPSGGRELARLTRIGLSRMPGLLPIAPLALLSVRQWVRALGVPVSPRFQRFLDASLLISAQTTAERANALYGATALDLPRQGVTHITGGIGALSRTLEAAIVAHGGTVRYRHRATSLLADGRRVRGAIVTHGRHTREPLQIEADAVIANMTPWSIDDLLPTENQRRASTQRRRQASTGAFVLHLGVREAAFTGMAADHHQVLDGLYTPLGEGNSIYISVSPAWDDTRAPKGHRAVTISTHTALAQWWELKADSDAAYTEAKQRLADRMLSLAERAIPGLSAHIALQMAGTPLTYATYTLRHHGTVGGFPQSSLFAAQGPRVRPDLNNLWMVGDSVFPGQSTAGVTAGAMRVVRAVRDYLGEA
jgi:C-3',4' desaturase CrtD